jgi:RND superfamily putative drug exporter
MKFISCTVPIYDAAGPPPAPMMRSAWSRVRYSAMREKSRVIFVTSGLNSDLGHGCGTIHRMSISGEDARGGVGSDSANGGAGPAPRPKSRGRWLKWLAVVFWLAVIAVAAPKAGLLYGVEQNSNDAYLPHTAESTQVLDYLQHAPNSPPSWEPAIVIYIDPAGISAADRARATQDQATLQSTVPGLEARVSAPVASADGKALAVTVPLLTPDNVDLSPALTAIRKVAEPGGSVDQGSLQVYVGGAAALQADASAAFSGLDTSLLYSAGSVVILVLLLTYRSPILWLAPIISAAFALELAQAIMYELVQHAGVVVSGQSGGILTVLVFGVGTDYALLLVARYREELHSYQDKHAAMAVALRRTAPAIIASALTVMLATLGLLVSQLASNVGLGKIGAIGVGCSLLAMLTLLPAVLLIMPRWVFWPAVPHYGTEAHSRLGLWGRVGEAIARTPRRIWVGASLLLVVLSFGLADLHMAALTTAESFISTPASVTAEQVRLDHFPISGNDPVQILVDPGAVAAVVAVLRDDPGLDSTAPQGLVVVPVGGRVLIEVASKYPASTAPAYATVDRLRPELHAIPGADALVGGTAAVTIDVENAASHDRDLVIPIVLVIAFLILTLLLRALVAPVVLIVSVIGSFLAALGASVFVFQTLLNRPNEDNSYPLFVFIFLVALGIDYNIFLMTRVREETRRIGTRPGLVKAVTVTGGVITSAGCVLAATFAVLATLPLTAFVQIGVAVAFGVLLDTMLVRSVLVPALCYDLGPRIWWPSRLAKQVPTEDEHGDGAEAEVSVGSA